MTIENGLRFTMRDVMMELPALNPRTGAQVAAEMWIDAGRDPRAFEEYRAAGLAAYNHAYWDRVRGYP